MLVIKTTVTEIKNAFDGLTRTLDMDVEKYLWAWGHVNGNFQNRTQREKKDVKNEIEYTRTVEQVQLFYIHIMRIPGEEEREKKKKQYWSNNDGEFPQINIGHQTIDRRVSDNTRKDKYQKKIYTKACHIQSAEDQRWGNNLGEDQGKIVYL